MIKEKSRKRRSLRENNRWKSNKGIDRLERKKEGEIKRRKNNKSQTQFWSKEYKMN